MQSLSTLGYGSHDLAPEWAADAGAIAGAGFVVKNMTRAETLSAMLLDEADPASDSANAPRPVSDSSRVFKDAWAAAATSMRWAPKGCSPCFDASHASHPAA